MATETYTSSSSLYSIVPLSSGPVTIYRVVEVVDGALLALTTDYDFLFLSDAQNAVSRLERAAA